MIRNDELLAIGRYAKPHGIHGELALTLSGEQEPEAGCCVVCCIDGINVPFFVESVRPKSSETVLVTLEGISDEREADMLANKTAYMLRRECSTVEDDTDTEGFFLDDMIEADVFDIEWGYLGKIESYDDRTVNLLLNIRRVDGSLLTVPVADEFISSYDPDTRRLEMNLPEGILEL